MDSIPDSTTFIQSRRSRQTLTKQQRQIIFETLLKQSGDGKPKWGSFKAVATLFSVNERTVRRIWKQSESFMTNGSMVDVSNNLAGRVGRKRVEIDHSIISQIPLRQRTNIRSLANASSMAKSTLHRRIKEGVIRPHSNALKPSLTNENKKARLQFCLSMLNGTSNLTNNRVFNNMFSYVNIDEKWFYMTKESQKYYLLPEEEEHLRTCKSKRFITKIMFLAAVARPRFDSSGHEEFSGKIENFPFTFQESAKRNSKNRVAGTLETKPISSITKEVVRSCLITKVLPAIRSKWPRNDTTDIIYIQQDNAKPHIDTNDVEFIEAASRDGFDIRLSFQPPNSPDFNVLDLGFFRAIQSLQYQEAPKTIDELVHAVENAFEDLPAKSLNNVFLTLQMCMVEVMKIYGGNNYKLPHMGKNQLEQNHSLPLQLQCDLEVVEHVLHHLQQQDQ